MNSGFLPNGSTTRTRPAPSSHASWIPLPYMQRAVEFLKSHYAGGLPLKPGGRKTSITLAAFCDLQREGKARTMLVIAPLRVARQVWRQEGQKWSEFRHLRFALLHGSKKDEALKSGADVYLINPEGVEWLCKRYMGRSLPFDVVAIDELTKFQNAQAQRHRTLRPRLAGVRYRWGLTGSLFSKGHMGIFGQQLILDDGAALGRYITHYRDAHFQVGFNGFDYDLLPGSEARIVAKLAPYWMHVDEADYAQLPDIVTVERRAQMDRPTMALYRQMQDDMIADLPGGQITAANAGACYTKLSQMANGAVYTTGPRGNRETLQLHTLKLDMLEELVDELDGEPLLVGYEFNADLERMQAWWLKRTGKELPYLGKGTTAKQEDAWVAAWNRNELPLLAAHPQSAGHGLNMQEGQACNVAWFSVTWDWELFDQFLRRVRRSGNRQAQVFNHLLIIDGTIDETKLAAVADKNFTEGRLINALATEILRESQGATQESTMVAKLSRPDSNPAPVQQAASGWGAAPVQQASPGPQMDRDNRQAAASPNGWGAAVGPDPNADQRARIQEQIAPVDRTEQARAAFSGGVAQHAQTIASTDYGPVASGGWGQAAQGSTNAAEQQSSTGVQQAPQEAEKPKRTRRTKAEIAAGNEPQDDDTAERIAIIAARASIVAAIAASDPEATVEDIVDAARSLMEFVERG